MTSLRMRVIRRILKPVMRWRMGRVNDPAQVRRSLDRASRHLFREPAFANYSAVASGPLSGLWVNVGTPAPGKVVLYLHGGGYLAGSPWAYRKLLAYLARACAVRVFAPRYRLAPEHPLPAALEDARAAYGYLLTQGYAPGDIVIGGDSAGGGLAFALLATLCEEGRAPAGTFGWSPCLDLTYSGASVQENSRRDHLFPGERVHDLSRLILGEAAAEDPRISPLFAAFPACCPVLLQVADSEILRDDSTRMERKLREQGTDVRLEMWRGAPHVWHMMAGFVPEADEAISNTGSFVRARLGL